MSDKSLIEWTEATWNPVRGCKKVSPGCKHCYAETFAERFRGVPGHAYEQGFDPRMVPEMLDQPLRWRRPRTVFVNSMSDLFGEFVTDDYIAAVFGVMAATPRHTYQVLTKRAERMAQWFEWAAEQTYGDQPINHPPHRDPLNALVKGLCEHPGPLPGLDSEGDEGESIAKALDVAWPLPNVWLGVSVENRKHGLPRIEHLRRTPAAVRFLSIEPLLEDLGTLDLTGIHWCIVGGETGSGAHPMHPAWARSIRDQCVAAGVPFFMKQWGQWGLAPLQIGRRGDVIMYSDGSQEPYPWLEDAYNGWVVMRRYASKSDAGRALDGRTWDQMPARST